MQNTSPNEASQHLHTSLVDPSNWKPSRIEVEVDDGRIESIGIVLRDSKKRLQLRFLGVSGSVDTSLDLLQFKDWRHLYVVDISHRQWEHAKVEVIGDDLDDGWTTLFWAEAVISTLMQDAANS